MNQQPTLKKIVENRVRYLRHLRRSRLKGAIASDQQGRPAPADALGSCACAQMIDVFYDYYGNESALNYRTALSITAKECRLIQAMNDHRISFMQIASILEMAWAPHI